MPSLSMFNKCGIANDLKAVPLLRYNLSMLSEMLWVVRRIKNKIEVG